ncbi:MAG TPA: cysteine synthase family protein [Thermoplasmata archaeon]|nr:cysteine synthase family protein [Thermoplasmata archaeon]
MFASDPAPVARRLAPLPPGPAPGASLPLPEPVGETPLVRLRRVVAGVDVELWAKIEAANPSGSVKDRAATAIVRAAIADRRLVPGRTLVDASSGNTAVAYARLAAQLGFSVRLFLPRNANPHRLDRLRALGAEVVLTDPAEGTEGARREARRWAEELPAERWFADQYNNPENPGAHYAGTGPEIWRQSGGRLTHLVAGVGTGGTISGAGRYLKERLPALRVVAVEPTGPMHGLEGLKHLPTAERPGTYDPGIADETVRVETEEAIAVADRVAREEQLTVGRSGGAALAAALRVGAGSPGSVLVVIVPDAGDAAEGAVR